MKNGVVYFSKCRVSGIFVSTTGVRITPILPPTKWHSSYEANSNENSCNVEDYNIICQSE